MENCLTNARLLSKAIEASGWYICISDVHRKKGEHNFKGTKAVVFSAEDETSADYNAGLPVVAFRLSDEFKKDFPHVKQESVSTLMRVKQYIIPSKQPSAIPLARLYSWFRMLTMLLLSLDYPLPPTAQATEILRVVVRESMSLDLLDRLITDLFAVTQQLMTTNAVDLAAFQPGGSNTVEKEHSITGAEHTKKHKAYRPKSHGVHRGVC